MDYLYYLFVVCGFLAVVLAVEGLYFVWDGYRGPQAKRIERRLRTVSAGAGAGAQTLVLKRRVLSELPAMDRVLMQIPRSRTLDRFLQQAGSDMTVAMFLGIVAATAVTGLLVPSFLNLPAAFGLSFMALFAAVPWLVLIFRRHRRLHKFQFQLPEALDLISRSMRAGHSFPSGLEMVANEGRDPISTEFKKTSDEINFGISVQEALHNLGRRVPGTDLSYFVVAVLIQRETGGNLTELLDGLSAMMRKRFQLFEKVRALSAEGRISGWILGIMPFVMAGVISVINPEFLSLLLDDPLGMKLVIGALVFMVIGALWMWRIVKIRV